MAVRILIFLLAFVVVTNLVISLVGLIFGVNMYQKFGKEILIGYAAFALIVIVAFIFMAIAGLA